MRHERLEQLLALALAMQSRADGISLNEIAQMFDLSRRTAERMRDTIAYVFPQIEYRDDNGPERRWFLPQTTMGRLAEITLDDLDAMGRARALAAAEGDSATAARIGIISDKLRDMLNRKTLMRIEPDLEALLQADGVAHRPGPRERLDPEIVTAIKSAILSGSYIDTDHMGRASGAISRNVRLGPVAFMLGQGRQYLVAYSTFQEDFRLYALSGFKRVTVLNEAFSPPDTFHLADYLQQAFGVFQEPAHDIVWRFDASVAEEAATYVFHPKQTTQTDDKGRLVVRFRSGGLREMAWHLFRWGSTVEIIAPEALKSLYMEMLAQALQGVARSSVSGSAR
jgi:predicted DNA-binding transcriptional regulator YafY